MADYNRHNSQEFVKLFCTLETFGDNDFFVAFSSFES